MGSSATLLRLLSVPAPTAEPVGKLDRLPRPGLRVYRAADRGIELRFSNSEDVGAGVGVGVGEPSEAVSGKGGLIEPDEALLVGISLGESTPVPFIAVAISTSSACAFAEGCSAEEGDSLGTSRLVRVGARRSCGLVTLIGKRVDSEAPLDRSRRCRWRGAGLVARLLLARRGIWLHDSSLATIHQLRNALNNSKVDYREILPKFEIPIVASVLKLYLLELPGSLRISEPKFP